MENPPTRILIIDTAWLGDVVFTTSLLGAVRKAWPKAELHALVAPRGESILRNHPYLNRLWVFDKHGSDRSAASLWRLASKLRAAGFECVLNAHPSFRSRLLTFLTHAPVRVGYRGFGDGIFLTYRVQNDLAVEPDHVKRRIALLKALVPEAEPAPLLVEVSPEEIKWSERFIKENKGNDKPLLALIPGSAWETKRWPSQYFAELAAKWIIERDGFVVVIGGSREQKIISEISARSPRILPFINQPIPRVAALLSRCNVVVGNDTGVSFLAVAAGAQRVLILYGCTQVDYALPSPHQAITAGVPCCLPRTGHGAHRCRWSDQPWCMQQISVDRVWNLI